MSLLVAAVRTRREPVIGLINVVFLMLIFFLIAGSIAPAPDRGLALVRIADLTTQAPPDAIVLLADGRLRHRGADGVDAAAYVATLAAPRVARILPDRDAPAAALVALADALHDAGAGRVVILGEKGAAVIAAAPLRPVRLGWRALALTGAMSLAAHAAVLVVLAPATGPVQIAGGAPGTIAALGSDFQDFTRGSLPSQPDAARPVTPTTPPRAAPGPVAPLAPVVQPERAEVSPLVVVAVQPIARSPATPPAPAVPAPAVPAPAVRPQTPPAATSAAVIAPTETARPMLLPRVTPAPEVVVHQATADTPRPAPRPDPQARRPAPAPQEAGNADRTARRGSAEGTPLSNAAAAAPQPTVAAAAPGNAEASNYPGLVMRRIQRVRQARVRAQGTALVAFTVGADGGLASVRLARASGNADLDAAALDHIRRAAPFPSPPPGAQRNFSFEFVGR